LKNEENVQYILCKMFRFSFWYW